MQKQGLRRRLLTRGKEIILSPQVMRLMSDDRVMKTAEGLLDARSRLKAAWGILKDGYELPPIDPALDEHLGEHAGPGINGKANGKSPIKVNGHANGNVNGHA